jgi:hypothetical protein
MPLTLDLGKKVSGRPRITFTGIDEIGSADERFPNTVATRDDMNLIL